MFCFPTLSWSSQVTSPLPAPWLFSWNSQVAPPSPASRNSEKSVPLACTPCHIVPPLRFVGQSMCPYGTLRLVSVCRCADCPFGLRPTDRPAALTTVNNLCNLSPCHPTGDKTPWGCALPVAVNKLCKMLWWRSFCVPCEQIVQNALEVLRAALCPFAPLPWVPFALSALCPECKKTVCLHPSPHVNITYILYSLFQHDIMKTSKYTQK